MITFINWNFIVCDIIIRKLIKLSTSFSYLFKFISTFLIDICSNIDQELLIDYSFSWAFKASPYHWDIIIIPINLNT